MGYLKHVETDQLSLPSDPQWVVQMKRVLPHGDQQAAQSAMLKVSTVDLAEVPIEKASQVRAAPDGQTGTLTEMELSEFLGTLLLRSIVSWNLTDEQDQPLPITRETIDMLDAEDGSFLQAEAQKRLTGGRPAEQAGPFTKPSVLPSGVTTSVIRPSSAS